MSDSQQNNFCHSCGDHVARGVIYCDSCQKTESGESDRAEKTWDDVKDTRSGTIATVTIAVIILIQVGLTVVALLSIGNIFFGGTWALALLAIFLLVVLLIVSVIIKKTWDPLRLRIESLE